jgi:hypothetical protein
MPPTPILAYLRPADGFVAGTLQKTSCAASRRADQPASSDGAGGLGEAVGDGDEDAAPLPAATAATA